MNRISVVINTLNEEKNIERALKSIISWVDEIVVVDMYSEDRTVEIARSYGAQVYLHERLGFADPAREFAIAQTSGDWILILDADELIPPELAQRLRRFAENDEGDVARIPRLNYFFGAALRFTGWGPEQDRQVRFFKPQLMQITAQIHHFMHPLSSARVVDLASLPDADIIHFNYLDTVQFVDKMNRYTSIEARQALEGFSNASGGRALLKIALEPFRRFVLWGGYRDGWRGAALSVYMFFYKFLVYAKMLELRQAGDRAKITQEYHRVADGILDQYLPDRPGQQLLQAREPARPQDTATRGVYVIIVNWNGWQMTVDCLESLERIGDIEKIIVVDNDSADGSFDLLRSTYPNVQVIQSGRNLGFGGGNNVGIKEALRQGAEYLWLLNNDTVVFEETLEPLLTELQQDDRLGAVSSALYRDRACTVLQTSGAGVVDPASGASQELMVPGAQAPQRGLYYLCAASILIRAQAIGEVGLFDEGYFMYWEDVDLSVRLSRAGWKLKAAAQSRVFHRESASLGKASRTAKRYFHQSARRFYRAHLEHPALPMLNSTVRHAVGEALRRSTGRSRK